jgi:6-phosphogluconolactonase
MKLETYPDREFLMLGLANVIAGQLADFLRREGKATLSVPGGTTPGPIFDTLSGVDLDWANVAVVLNDERWVPESSERSNTRLLRERLLRGRAAQARLVPLVCPRRAARGNAGGAGGRAEAASADLGSACWAWGRTCTRRACFPARTGWKRPCRPAPILMPMRAEAAGEPRITLTAPVLREAFNIHILITGPEKRAALERAMTLTPMEAPVRAVLDNATVHWAE